MGNEGKDVESGSRRSSTVIVDLENSAKKPVNKNLEKRLSHTNEPKTVDDIKAKQNKAASNREAVNQEKKDKAAEITMKAQAAQEKALSDKAKKAKAKAEKEAVVATVIKVDVDKDGTKLPPKDLQKRISTTKKIVSSQQLQSGKEKAVEVREAITRAKVDKAGGVSKKVEKAQIRAESDEAKKDRAKAEKTASSAIIINVETDKNLSKKPNEGLIERLNKKETPAEKIKERHDKARESRDSSTQAQVEKASARSKKVEAAQARAETVEAKKDKAKAERTQASSIIINVSTDQDRSKKAKKGLKERLSREKKQPTEEEIKARKDKATESRDAIIKGKVKKAAAESVKVEEAKVRAGTDKAKEARELQAKCLAAHKEKENEKAKTET